MTSRQRFHETMRYGAPDRVPYFEEGLRDDVLERWREQGLAQDADLSEMFHTDHRERLAGSLEPIPPLDTRPPTRSDLRELWKRLDSDDPSRFPDDWAARVQSWRTRDHVLELPIHRGFFLTMGVHDWADFERVIELLTDDPSLVHEIMEIHGEFSARLAERVLREAEVDFVSFSEPIGGNNGPLLSPRTYARFVVAHYRPVLEVLRRHSVEIICFVTYANARVLLPCVIEAGFNCLWACEVNAEAMDYRTIRREFGRDLRLIGGVDLDALSHGQEGIRRELEEKVPALLEDGGYVPLADGRVRVDVPLEDYVYYHRLLEEIVEGR